MCDKVQTALEVIKTQQKRTLTKGEIVMLFQQVVSDLNKQGEKMTNLEKRMESLENKMDAGFTELKKLIEDKKVSFWDKIPLLKDIPNLAWILLIIICLIIGSVFGANVDFVKYLGFGG